MKGIFWIIVFLLLNSFASAFADDITFEVTVDRGKVSLGENLQLDLSFYGTQDVPTPYFPGVDGFDWRYLGPSTLTSIINGQVSNSITHRYKLIPSRVGTFQIPSFSIQFRGKTYTSAPIPVEVVRGPVSRPQTGQIPDFEDRTYGLEDRVFLAMEVGKKQTYVNELVPVTIKLYVNNLALRDIRYPQISHEGFSIEEFGQPRQYRDALTGILYNVIEFKTSVFAMRAGKLTLGPAQLECNLLIKEKTSSRFGSSFFDDDFFARYKSYPLSLKSSDIPITIVTLPEEERPAEFTGAVGSYRFSLSAEPREVKVGDPITLKMAISGKGNFKTVNSPELKLKDEFKVYEPDVKQEKGTKTFERVIIPRNDKINEIPSVGFSFFNPQSGKYQKIVKGPIAIKVNPLPEGEGLKVFEISKEGGEVLRRKEILGRDIIYIKDMPGEFKRKGALLCKNRLFIALQFIPLLALVAISIFQKKKERLRTDISYARRLCAPGKARKNLQKARNLFGSQKPEEFFDAVFKALQEYLGDKFYLPTAGITSNVIEELKLRNIDQDILNKVGECFNSCDMARYAPASISKEDMLKSLKLLEEIIDRLEKIKV